MLRLSKILIRPNHTLCIFTLMKYIKHLLLRTSNVWMSQVCFYIIQNCLFLLCVCPIFLNHQSQSIFQIGLSKTAPGNLVLMLQWVLDTVLFNYQFFLLVTFYSMLSNSFVVSNCNTEQETSVFLFDYISVKFHYQISCPLLFCFDTKQNKKELGLV